MKLLILAVSIFYSVFAFSFKPVIIPLDNIETSLEKDIKQPLLLSDEEIEFYLIGKWFISPNDSAYEYTYATLTYSKDYILSFISYTDKNCTIIDTQAVGTWEVKNKILITTMEQSIPLGAYEYGEKFIDNILSINSKDKILMSVDDTKKQYRTKLNSCREY